MLQPSDPKKRYSGSYRRDKKTGKVAPVAAPKALALGKYSDFFAEEGNTRNGARALVQKGKHYNVDAFKNNILPRLQEMNPDTDFYYEGNNYKCGGKINKMEEGGGLTEFNEGGSHAANPNGGVQQGVGENGLPNMVEEGETKAEGFVFSNNFSIPERLVEMYNLPKYLSGKTPAEQTKIMDKRFDGRSDAHTKSTKKAMLGRISEAQERYKLEQDAKEMGMSVEGYQAYQEEQAVQQAKMEAQAAAQGGAQANQMLDGGQLGGLLDGASEMMGAASEDLANDEDGVNKEINVGANAAKYGVMGASAGTMIMPGLGTGIGAGIGAGTGAALAVANNAKIPRQQQESDLKEQGQVMLAEGYNSNVNGSEGEFDTGAKRDWIEGAVGMTASLAPLAGNIISRLNIADAEKPNYARTGRTFIPNYADEKKALNVVDDSFGGIEDSIANASNGSLGAYRSNLIASKMAKARARSNAYSNINEINRQQDTLRNADFARAAREDTELHNRELLEYEQNIAAVTGAKSTLDNSIYEGLGGIGETIFGVSQMDDQSSYNRFGQKKLTQEQKDNRKLVREKRRAIRKNS